MLPGSVEDALLFFNEDLPLWVDTEGLVEYVRDFLHSREIAPPLVEVEEDADDEEEGEGKAVDEQQKDNEANEDDENENEGEVKLTDEELHEMFLDMFNTGLEMLEESEEDEEDEE